MESTDIELLRTYVQSGQESAFTALVERHVGWISTAARRRVGDDHLADDVAQIVFLLLLDKSAELAQRQQLTLSAWLFRVMHFTCIRQRRTRSRGSRHELLAGLEKRAPQPAVDQDSLMQALLEDTINQLRPQDREAIVRRFYRNEDLTQIGHALNLSPDAVRKRIARALATIGTQMLQDHADVIPEELLSAMKIPLSPQQHVAEMLRTRLHAKEVDTMIEQAEAIEFAVMSAEFYVNDVEANLAFFEKLGFRRRWSETPDAMGRLPRASLVGGQARIWLRRSTDTEGTRPQPGVGVFFWIDGGPDALAAHRKRIAAAGVEVCPYADDHTLRNFTVTTPDGYSIGFFTTYQ